MYFTPLSGDDFADLFAASDLIDKLDTGPTAILTLRHPRHGELVIVDSFVAGPSLISPEPYTPTPRPQPLW